MLLISLTHTIRTEFWFMFQITTMFSHVCMLQALGIKMCMVVVMKSVRSFTVTSEIKSYFLLSPRFSKKKRGLCVTVRRPSVRPSGNTLPASPPTLLMLESPNLYA